ncbi:ankycorbin-like isoform X7 [Brienomyrus brachyistius]|uniref:ankycorbin-like isoform X7 n=1 Tax=Brienomyrus brachyistius TaxID=42636 RepID=UPI0020B3A9B6|nr:ankycorbin-like isoform X7 [Brienomyrus brachyistius]
MDSQLLLNWMKRYCPCFSALRSLDWNKSDERLLQAVEQNNPDKAAALLVKKGLCPSKLDPDGKSAFHVSASKGRMDCLDVFLSHGVDVTSPDGSGLSALHLAAKNGHATCVRRLLREGIPVDLIDGFGRTALHHAVVHGYFSCVEMLGNFKACVNAQDADGVTPLLLAAQMGRAELCVFLLDQGANVNQPDSEGRSALMLAYKNGNLETIDALLRGGANPQSANEAQCLNKLLQPTVQAPEGTGEEMEDIFRLKPGRAHLLHKLETLERQHHSAHSVLEELCVLQEQLEKVEGERVRLQVAIQNLLETPQLETENFGAEKPLSPKSRDSEPEFVSAREDYMSQGDCDSLRTPLSQGNLHAWWTLQGQMEDQILKAQRMEMSESDSVDMQSLYSLLVPIDQFDALANDNEDQQKTVCESQASAAAPSLAKEDGCVGPMGPNEHVEELEDMGELRRRLQGLEKELAQALMELNELKSQVPDRLMVASENRDVDQCRGDKVPAENIDWNREDGRGGGEEREETDEEVKPEVKLDEKYEESEVQLDKPKEQHDVQLEEKEEIESDLKKKKEGLRVELHKKEREAESELSRNEESKLQPEKKDEGSEVQLGKKEEESKVHLGNKEEESKVHLGNKEEETKVHLGNKEEESKVHLGNKEEESKVHLGNKEEESKVHLGNKEEETKVHLGNKEVESKVHLGNKEEESKVHLGNKEEESNVHLGKKEEESKVHLGKKEEESKVHLGKKEEESEVQLEMKGEKLEVEKQEEPKVQLAKKEECQELNVELIKRKEEPEVQLEKKSPHLDKKEDPEMKLDKKEEESKAHLDKKEEESKAHLDKKEEVKLDKKEEEPEVKLDKKEEESKAHLDKKEEESKAHLDKKEEVKLDKKEEEPEVKLDKKEEESKVDLDKKEEESKVDLDKKEEESIHLNKKEEEPEVKLDKKEEVKLDKKEEEPEVKLDKKEEESKAHLDKKEEESKAHLDKKPEVKLDKKEEEPEVKLDKKEDESKVDLDKKGEESKVDLDKEEEESIHLNKKEEEPEVKLDKKEEESKVDLDKKIEGSGVKLDKKEGDRVVAEHETEVQLGKKEETEAILVKRGVDREALTKRGGDTEGDAVTGSQQEEEQQGVMQVGLDMLRLTFSLQLEQVARERAEAASQLSEALLELKRLQCLPAADKEDCCTQTSLGCADITVEEELIMQQEVNNCLCRQQDVLHTSQHQEALSKFTDELAKVARELQVERALRKNADQEIARLQAELQVIQQDMISKEEHEKVKLALQHSLEANGSSVWEAQQAQRNGQQGAATWEEREVLCNMLRGQLSSLTTRLNDLSRKHQNTCSQVLRVQREALFSKAARQAAEAQLSIARQHLAYLRTQSDHLGAAKEGGGLPDLSPEILYGSLPLTLVLPSSPCSDQQVAPKSRVATLKRQLQDWEEKHRAVVSVYRAHLLAAVQGRMDEEVQALLLQILRMTQTEPGH